VVGAADWPQWLGPERNGHSTEAVPAWKEPPRVLWRQPVGEGHSSPVVAGGRVYLLAKVKDKNEEELLAFQAADGKPLFRTAYPRGEFQSIFGNGPRATSTVADGRVWTFGVTGLLTCFDAANGKQLWQVDTLQRFRAVNLFFGASCSPLVLDQAVLVNVGGKGASVVAFDREKGEKVLWQQLDDPASYASPIVLGQGPTRQVLFLTQQGLRSFEAASGKLAWQFPLVDKINESSTTPCCAGDVLIASSVTFGSVGLALETKDGQPGVKQLWKNPALTCYFSTPVAVGGEHVYMVTGGLLPPPSVTLRCVEVKTGKELWNKPKMGRYHAALLGTGDGKLLLLDDNGNLLLLDPSPQEYRELARAKVCGQTWAHPALADGKLYLRDDRELLCLQLRP
jgi:outer membrane protein assembly factor BamB